MTDVWDGDRLGYDKIGHAFTNLVQSIDTEKVISIEAGFGRGKTFFRTAWAQQLRDAGEVVVEVDVQQSDHSGDPVITLLGALLEALPKTDESKGKKAIESAKKLAAVGAKTVGRMVLKSGADEIIDVISDTAIDKLEDFDALDGVIKDAGSAMSKVAGEIIASQMASEKVRKKELPEQLETMRAALTEGAQYERVVVIIDELDRCHPEYAISFLEAMKLIFNQYGFVFCLMVNADYLERLAHHRFGAASGDEKYLDKFVDIRLKLEPKPEAFTTAVYDLALDLPLEIPFGDSADFSIERAANLAGELATLSRLSMRKTKRVLLKIELALRCYSDHPLDAPLLVFMAFSDENSGLKPEGFLKRATFTPEFGESTIKREGTIEFNSQSDVRKWDQSRTKIIMERAPELLELPVERYSSPDDKGYKDWVRVLKHLTPVYIPFHREVLDSVASVLVSDSDPT